MMLSSKDIKEQDESMPWYQKKFQTAAEYVAVAFARIPAVEKVVLFGSVAMPLKREVPRFREFRREGIEIFHECKDVDLAVWLNDLGILRLLQKARSSALNELLEEKDIGVAHHQVDVFIMEPVTDRYMGRLCAFAKCPKGKDKCRVPGCGEVRFLRQHEEFVFDPKALESQNSVVLYCRAATQGNPIVDGKTSS
jgi:predicted nucleotidyltransferase